jgi:hypothetical protein
MMRWAALSRSAQHERLESIRRHRITAVQVRHAISANGCTMLFAGERPMKVVTVTLALFVSAPALLVSDRAAAQECQTCSSADACMQTYLKAVAQAQRDTKQAIRDWKENLDKKASGELFSKGTAALAGAMESQVRSELERLKECLAKIK